MNSYRYTWRARSFFGQAGSVATTEDVEQETKNDDAASPRPSPNSCRYTKYRTPSTRRKEATLLQAKHAPAERRPAQLDHPLRFTI